MCADVVFFQDRQANKIANVTQLRRVELPVGEQLPVIGNMRLGF